MQINFGNLVEMKIYLLICFYLCWGKNERSLKGCIKESLQLVYGRGKQIELRKNHAVTAPLPCLLPFEVLALSQINRDLMFQGKDTHKQGWTAFISKVCHRLCINVIQFSKLLASRFYLDLVQTNRRSRVFD